MRAERKGKHKGELVYLFGDEIIAYDAGFKSLAESCGVDLDTLFLGVMGLGVHGLVEMMPVKRRSGRMGLRFRIARDLREAKEIRGRLIEGSKLDAEVFENLEKVRDRIFGPVAEN